MAAVVIVLLLVVILSTSKAAEGLSVGVAAAKDAGGCLGTAILLIFLGLGLFALILGLKTGELIYQIAK